MPPNPITALKGGLIVSCQAYPPNPFAGPHFMAAFAQAAEMAGAVGLRVNGAADIRAVRAVSGLPIIGIDKQMDPRYPVYITPTPAAAVQLIEAGATIVAVDATHRPRPGGLTPEALIAAIRATGAVVMADVDTVEEGAAAAAAGADMVATTLAGYTPQRVASDGPDLTLLRDLVETVSVPVICEGRVRRPDDLRAALAAGAYAVVVGTAITNPQAIAAEFVAAARRWFTSERSGG